MIVWGGYSYDGIDHYWNTGGRYNPGTDSWVATSTTNAPDGREFHSAVWTGSTMIVWGGFDGGNELNTGGMYNPGTNRWTPLSTTNAPTARESHGAIWTGSEMIVWGGAGTSGYSEHGWQIRSYHQCLDSDQHSKCTLCSRPSQPSMDWQRNDRVGRLFL